MKNRMLISKEQGLYIASVFNGGKKIRAKLCSTLEWAMRWCEIKSVAYRVSRNSIFVDELALPLSEEEVLKREV